MRILVHDHAGYPFTLELARSLAARHHHVCYSWCTTFLSPNSASLSGSARYDPTDRLVLSPVSHQRSFEKYRWLKRSQQECEYAVKAGRLLASLKPDVVLSANVPLLTQFLLGEAVRVRRISSVVWLQDLYSLALSELLPAHGRVRGIVALAGAALERRALGGSQRVVTISPGLRDAISDWGIDRSDVTIIPNWAPIGDLPTA